MEFYLLCIYVSPCVTACSVQLMSMSSVVDSGAWCRMRPIDGRRVEMARLVKSAERSDLWMEKVRF